MSDWRTSQAFPAQRSRLPEDDLPEIDWGAADFSAGGGDMPEPEPMPDPSEEERAMARLRARIAERDAPLMDPWAQEQAVPLPGPHPSPSSLASGPLAPLRAPRMGRSDIGFPAVGMPEMMPPAAPPAPPMNPQQAAQAAFRQPALDAVRAGVGAVTPPVDPMAPPSSPTAPDAVPQATTDPNAPTVTAGSQAAGLAQRPAAPRSPTMAPTGAPQFAMGATGLGGVQSGMSDRVAAGAPDGNVFGRQLDAARNEDVRRERIRKIILGIGAMLGAGTGNMGLMLPAAIGAGLVRDPDEEATLRANDERAQAVGGAQAEQRALLEQLAMRREAQQATERQGQQTLALRAAELQGTQEDRRTRTGLAVAEEGRDAAMLDPGSDVSARNRMQFREWLRTSPREIQQAVDPRTLDGLSATEILTLQDELSSNYNSRQIGGGRGGGGAGAGAAAGLRAGQRQGLDEVPEAYVNMIRSRVGADQDVSRTAQALWEQETPETQRDYLGGTMADRWRTRRLVGYEQEDGGLDVSETTIQATQEDIEQLARLQGMEDRAMTAADQTSGGALAANVFGVSLQDQVTEYNIIRNDLIGILNRIQSGSSLDASERVNWEAMIPGLSDPRALLSGDPQRALRIAFRSARQQLDDRIRVRGFRATPGTTAPTTTADAPPAPEREHTITIRATRNGETRSRTVPISEADAWRAEAERNGWVVQ